jgi:ubiquinone/menaquinone biosynthesis C-methylase UbiE
MSKLVSSPSYSLLTGSQEYERLRVQSRLYESYVKEILRDLEIREGMSCLDVGCGPGEVMRLMGEIVGPTGRVTGFDMDQNMVAEALSYLRSAGIKSELKGLTGDVTKVETISDEQYDLVYSRFLIPHLKDVPSILKKMFDCVKPGGWFVIQERDFSSSSVYPQNSAIEEILTNTIRASERAGIDAKIGRKLPTYFIDAGIGVPDGSRVYGSLRPISDANILGMLKGYKSAILPLAIKFGMTTRERGEEVMKSLDSLPNKDSYFLLGSLFITVWKRKSVT